jgi:hypothetical protein
VPNAIAVDSLGNTYVTGNTVAPDFPTTSGAFESRMPGIEAAFVTKLNSGGTGLIYSTYLGNQAFSSGSGIAVDSSGNAYVTGWAGNDFPTVGSMQNYGGGRSDAFVTKFNASGAVIYSTFLGGGHGNVLSFVDNDIATSIALDSNGIVYVTGSTDASDFPTINPIQAANAGGTDAFVAKIDPRKILGYELVSNRVVLAPGAVADVIVSCSSGNKVLGGGFSVETPQLVKVFSSEPTDQFGSISDHNWHVFAQNADLNNPRQVTVSATCALGSHLTGHEVVFNRVSVPASSSTNVTSACSSGNKVLGGGFEIETPDWVKVFSSLPSNGITQSDQDWNVYAQNIFTTSSRQTTAFAVCASASALSGYQILSSQMELPVSNIPANTNVSCPSGGSVMGGGFAVDDPNFVSLYSSQPSDGHGNFSDHNWNVLAQNVDPVNSHTATVTAICDP